MLPPHYLFLSLATMFALSYISDSSLLPGMWRLAGVVPIALGLWVAGTALRQFAKADTNTVPLTESTTLVTNGIFTRTRNPMYIGMTAILIGAALLLNQLWPWLVIPPFWLMIRIGFVRREETLMEQTFGKEYRQYQTRVRRWL